MARQTAKKINKLAKTTSRSKTINEPADIKGMVNELFSNPTVRYVAGGLAAALLTKITSKITDRYPEISGFLKENLPDLSARIDQFRSSGSSSSINH